MAPRPPLTAGVGRAKGVNDGDGFVIISDTGEIYPSGFLPVSAGNVRTDSIVDIYPDAPLFRERRDRSLRKEECGACEYREICGDGRARAHASMGDWLEAEPYRVHVPSAYRRMVEAARGA